LQRALKAGIPVFGRGLGTLDSETLDAALNALESLRLSGRTIGVISHIDQLTRYPVHTCEDRCEKDRGRDFNYTCEGVGWKILYPGGCPVSPPGWELKQNCWLPGRPGEEEHGREPRPWRMVEYDWIVCKGYQH